MCICECTPTFFFAPPNSLFLLNCYRSINGRGVPCCFAARKKKNGGQPNTMGAPKRCACVCACARACCVLCVVRVHACMRAVRARAYTYAHAWVLAWLAQIIRLTKKRSNDVLNTINRNGRPAFRKNTDIVKGISTLPMACLARQNVMYGMQATTSTLCT